MANPLAPPESWELATPVFGIRYPKPTAPAKFLPDAFGHIGADLENALIADGATPPGLNYKTGTNAQRLAATPAANQIWIETDTPGNPQYIGTGSAWIALGVPSQPEVRRWNVERAGVPSGTTLFMLGQNTEITADRTPTYPTITYAGGDLSWTLTTPGWYTIFLTTYINWANAGNGAKMQIMENNTTDLPVSIAYFNGGQNASLSWDGVKSDGTKKLFFGGFHNAGGSYGLNGRLTFVKLRGL